MQPGEVYSVFVPYADQQGGKYRPALIMSTSNNRAIAVGIKITKTPPTRNFPHRIFIQGWRSVPLRYPSYAQYDFVIQLNTSFRYNYIGKLLPSDFQRITSVFRQYHGV